MISFNMKQSNNLKLVLIQIVVLAAGAYMVLGGTVGGGNSMWGFTWVNSTNINALNYYIDSTPITTFIESLIPATHQHDQDLNTTDAPTFRGVSVDWLDLDGDNRSLWPTGEGGGFAFFHSGEYIIFENVSGVYAQDLKNGVILYSGAVFDTVLNQTAALGGMTQIAAGDYVLSTGKTILCADEGQHIQISGGVNITIPDESPAFNLFTIDADRVTIEGDGLLSLNRGGQINEQVLYYLRSGVSDFLGSCYVWHLNGRYMVNDAGSNSNNNKWINRYYADAMETVTPIRDIMLSNSKWYTVYNFSEGGGPATLTETYGDGVYISDAISKNTSLKMSPNLGESATEPVRVRLLWSTGQNWSNANIGIWMKFEGELNDGFDLTLELWDKDDSQAALWTLYNIDDALNSSKDPRWHLMMFTPPANTTDTVPRINMSDIDDVRIRFLSTVDTWNVTLDELMLFPHYNNHPNGGALFCYDGPYPKQFTQVIPLANEYGVKVCLATSYDIEGEAGGNADLYLDNMTQAKKDGHLIGSYIRCFDEETPPRPYSDAQVLDFALMQKQYIIDHDLATDGFYFAQFNRHLLDVHVYNLLSPYFHVLKGTHPDGQRIFNLPWIAFDTGSTTPAADLSGLQEAHQAGAITLKFNHHYSEDYPKSDIEANFAYVAANNMDSVTWRDLWLEMAICGE